MKLKYVRKALATVLAVTLFAGGISNLPVRAEEMQEVLNEENVHGDEAEGITETVASGQCGENATYTLDSEGMLTISGSGALYDYSEAWGFASENNLFDEKTIRKVVINDGITSIGKGFFNGNSDMENIEIPESVTSIGAYAFRNCRSLTSIELSGNIAALSGTAFDGCTKLLAVNIAENNDNYVSREGVVYNKDVTEIVLCPWGKADVVIAEGVKSIERFVFEKHSLLKSVKIPQSMMTISDNAFNSCTGLENVEIAEGVKSIGDAAFAYCPLLKSVLVPESVTEIGNEAFGFDNNDGKIEDFTLQCYPESAAEAYAVEAGIAYKYIEADSGEKLTDSGICGENATWTYADGVLTISGNGEISWTRGADTPYDWTPWYEYKNEITKLILSEGITSISFQNGSCFRSMPKLEEVVLPETLPECPAFYDCVRLKKVELPDSMKIIYKGGFEGCTALADENGLAIINSTLVYVDEEKAGVDIVIPEGVKESASYLPWTMRSISIPSTFQESENLLYSLHMNYDALEKIEVSEENAVYTSVDGCLLSKDKKTLLVVPGAKKGKYAVPDGVETVGYSALSHCAYLTEVMVPESVKTIEEAGCWMEPGVSVYFTGNAVEDTGNMFYDQYFDSDEFKEWYENAEPTNNAFADLMQAIAGTKIYYVEGTSGWNELKEKYPRVQWLTWDGKSSWEEENPGGNSNSNSNTNTGASNNSALTTVSVSGQKTTEELTTAMLSAISSGGNGAAISVEVSEGCVLTQEVMQQLKDKNDKLIVVSDTASGRVTWTFDKIENTVAFNPAVIINSQAADMINKLKETSVTYVPVSFVHEGILPGKAEVYLDLTGYGSAFSNGSTLYLYYYNPSTGLFEKVSTGTYDGTGVTFVMEHCSDYIVTNTELAETLTTKNISAPKTGDYVPNHVYVWVSLLLVMFIILTYYVDEVMTNAGKRIRNKK